MGTENDLDVEAQTEPPICGPKSKSSIAFTISLSPTPAGTFVNATAGPDADAEPGAAAATDTDADATPITVGTGRASLASTVDTVAATAPSFFPEIAHTLSVPDVCALLDTDAE